jgi:hypothetical protein
MQSSTPEIPEEAEETALDNAHVGWRVHPDSSEANHIRRALQAAAPVLRQQGAEEAEQKLESWWKDTTNYWHQRAGELEQQLGVEREAAIAEFLQRARWAQEDSEKHRARGDNEAAQLARERERTYALAITYLREFPDNPSALRAALDNQEAH